MSLSESESPPTRPRKAATFAEDNEVREYTTDLTEPGVLPPERWETPPDPYMHREGRTGYPVDKPPINAASPDVVVKDNERKYRRSRGPCASRDDLIRVLTELARLDGLLKIEENYKSSVSKEYRSLTGVSIEFYDRPRNELTPEQAETARSLKTEYGRVQADIRDKRQQIEAVKADRNRLYTICGFPTTGLRFGSKKMSERRRAKIERIYYLLTF